jgi:hypothetical protein
MDDAPPALKHDGELIPDTFGVDQRDDAVLVGFDSARECIPVGVRIFIRPRIERSIGVLLNFRQAVGSSRC